MSVNQFYDCDRVKINDEPDWATSQVHPLSCGPAVVESELKRRKILGGQAESYKFQQTLFSAESDPICAWCGTNKDIREASMRFGLTGEVAILEGKSASNKVRVGGSAIVMLSIPQDPSGGIVYASGHFVLICFEADIFKIWDPDITTGGLWQVCATIVGDLLDNQEVVYLSF